MRGEVGRGRGADLEHCENAGRIYQVYAGLSYKFADLRICIRTKGAILRTLRICEAINQSINRLLSITDLTDLRICIRICGAGA